MKLLILAPFWHKFNCLGVEERYAVDVAVANRRRFSLDRVIETAKLAVDELRKCSTFEEMWDSSTYDYSNYDVAIRGLDDVNRYHRIFNFRGEIYLTFWIQGGDIYVDSYGAVVGFHVVDSASMQFPIPSELNSTFDSVLKEVDEQVKIERRMPPH